MKVSNQKLNSFNEKLINKINENSVTIDDVLSHKNIIYSVKRQNKKITEFLINHIDEVLKIATICDSNKSYKTGAGVEYVYRGKTLLSKI